MLFNERLIELRKKEGLSQEELGEKLNVTRQTVSKWELGQTTPEMEKLVEISKLFNVSIDELVKNNETVNDYKENVKQEKDNTNRNNIIKIVLVGILLISIIFIGYDIYSKRVAKKIYDKGNEMIDKNAKLIENTVGAIKDMSKDDDEKQKGFIGGIAHEIKNNMEEIESESENFDKKSEQMKKDHEKLFLKTVIENQRGENLGTTVKRLLDDINSYNAKYQEKITVKFGELETQDEEEIIKIKHKMEDLKKYEVIIKYDDSKEINKVIIEEI